MEGESATKIARTSPIVHEIGYALLSGEWHFDGRGRKVWFEQPLKSKLVALPMPGYSPFNRIDKNVLSVILYHTARARHTHNRCNEKHCGVSDLRLISKKWDEAITKSAICNPIWSSFLWQLSCAEQINPASVHTAYFCPAAGRHQHCHNPSHYDYDTLTHIFPPGIDVQNAFQTLLLWVERRMLEAYRVHRNIEKRQRHSEGGLSLTRLTEAVRELEAHMKLSKRKWKRIKHEFE